MKSVVRSVVRDVVRSIGGVSGGGGIPFKSDALFWLDGTIIDIGGSKYFQDCSGNGRHFLITGYDFDSTWSKGFLYKTAATISAPAGDTALIAADINHFLYDSGGTPNQIPVISLFQDIDYEHKLFCRHTPQVLDSNGVETYEPRVLDITLYNTVKSGVDLTTCQTYYSVPIEITTNVKWVSPLGNDTTGNGSKINPWLTLTKANTSMTSGDTVYVKTGTYNETGQWIISQNSTWIGLGYNIVKSTGTARVVVNQTSNNESVTGFIFDGESKQSYVIQTASTCTYSKCKAINPKNADYSILIYDNYTGCEFRNCVFLGIDGTRGWLNILNNVTVNSCYITAQIVPGASGKTIEFNNNKFNYNHTSSSWFIFSAASNSNIIIKGGSIILNAYAGILSTIAETTSTLSIENCNITINQATNGFLSFSNGYFANVIFSNNHIINNDLDAFIIYNYGTTGGEGNFTIENNYIQTINYGITLYKLNTATTAIIIRNNTIISSGIAGYGILVGNEATGTGDNSINSLLITNNKLIGAGGSTLQHGIFVGFQGVNATIKNNFINSAEFGIALKGNATDYTNTLIEGNLITNSSNYGLIFSGSRNSKIYNNTLINNNVEVVFYANIGSNGATGHTLKNNIFYNTTSRLYMFDSYSYTQTIDYNCIYYTVGLTQKNYNTTPVNLNLAQWQADGFDVHSLNQNPNFKSSSELWPIPAITGGENLGTDYDDGLDITTNWGSSTQVPVVVTKQQGSIWDIGAYIH